MGQGDGGGYIAAVNRCRNEERGYAMFGMNQDQVLSIARQVLMIVGSLAIALGWISADKVGELSANILAALGPMMVLGSSVWSLIAHTQANTITSAASMTDSNGTPVVKQVDLNPAASGAQALNRATPSNVVVGSST